MAAPNSPAVVTRNLSKTYRESWRGKPVHALRGVTFDVRCGKIFGLLGPNGAGKTTFIKALLGMVRPSGGSAELLGQPAGRRESRRRVGYLPENLRVPWHHSAKTAIKHYGALSNLPSREALRRGDDLLERMGIADWRNEQVARFSKGMKQRLGLTLALLNDPELLILDEPTDGLDPVGRREVRAELAKLRDEGRTIFLNSHLLQEVELICDEVAILDRGELKYVGPVDAVSRSQVAAAGVVSGGAAAEAFIFELELVGEARAVRDALRGFAGSEVEAVAEEAHRARVPLGEMAQIDRVVDELRTSGVSIVGLKRQKQSLEEAFVELLKKG